MIRCITDELKEIYTNSASEFQKKESLNSQNRLRKMESRQWMAFRNDHYSRYQAEEFDNREKEIPGLSACRNMLALEDTVQL